MFNETVNSQIELRSLQLTQNILTVVFWAKHLEIFTMVKFSGWEALFLWLSTLYQWRVNTNSLKYVMKKKPKQCTN